jgi:hypothetical protein
MKTKEKQENNLNINESKAHEIMQQKKTTPLKLKKYKKKGRNYNKHVVIKIVSTFCCTFTLGPKSN